jgi:hypothetical protein
MVAAPTSIERIEAEEAILLQFWTRFVALQAFEAELIARTGTREFEIANTVIWAAMIAKRDLLVIHFASWIRGITGNGGLFKQLRANHFPELRRAFSATRTEQPGIAGRDRRRVQIDLRLPGAAQRGRLDPADIDDLGTAVHGELAPVVADRNSFRAHPYERGDRDGVRWLAIEEVEGLLLAAQRLMNDLRLLIDNSTFGYSYQSLTGAENAARDLVDLLLFHDIQHFATLIGANALPVYWWERRDEFIAALRVEQNRHPAQLLNNDAVVQAASARARAAIEASEAARTSLRARARNGWRRLRRRLEKLRR